MADPEAKEDDTEEGPEEGHSEEQSSESSERAEPKDGKAEGKASKPKTAGERLAAKKAAKAAKKAAQRGRDAEARETEVIKRASAAGQWARDNRRLLVGALVAVVVVVGGATGYVIWSGQRASEAASSLWQAVEKATASVRAEGTPADDETESFTTFEARAKAASEEFDETLTSHAGTNAAVWARLGQATAMLEADDVEAARKAFAKVRSEAGEDQPYLEMRALEGLGFTFEAEEAWDKAIERYEAMGKVGGGRYGELADYHLARAHMAKGDEGKAKEILRGLLDELGEEDAPELPYVEQRAQRRLEALDPSEARAGGGMPGGGMPGVSGIGQGQGPGKGKQPSPEQMRKIIEQLKKAGQMPGAGGGGMPAPPGGGGGMPAPPGGGGGMPAPPGGGAAPPSPAPPVGGEGATGGEGAAPAPATEGGGE